MTPQEFCKRHEDSWRHLEEILERKTSDAEFPALYRQLCAHLALARDRHYPLSLVERLNLLALKGQQHLYQHQGGLWLNIKSFIRGQFPELVRHHSRLFWFTTGLFYFPLFIMAAAIWWHPELIYSVMSPAQVDEFEAMYNPTNKAFGKAYDENTHMAMFGFYVRHNTGIGFQTFGGGLFAGIGSLFYLLYNAIQIGAVAGHLTHIGYSATFLPFVITHGAFELTAIILSSMSGFMIGSALIAPGQQTRRDALISRGHDAVRILVGAAAMFFIAAIFEGFWSSSSTVPAHLKYEVGTLMWLLVSWYFLLVGKKNHAP